MNLLTTSKQISNPCIYTINGKAVERERERESNKKLKNLDYSYQDHFPP